MQGVADQQQQTDRDDDGGIVGHIDSPFAKTERTQFTKEYYRSLLSKTTNSTTCSSEDEDHHHHHHQQQRVTTAISEIVEQQHHEQQRIINEPDLRILVGNDYVHLAQ
jgi:hypothetical protein